MYEEIPWILDETSTHVPNDKGEKRKGKKPIDLEGKIFGRLTVLKFIGHRLIGGKVKKRVYLCQCSCGNTCEVLAEHLRNGKIRSCGCLRRDFFKNDAPKKRKENELKRALEEANRIIEQDTVWNFKFLKWTVIVKRN